jgi:hypothetical protein
VVLDFVPSGDVANLINVAILARKPRPHRMAVAAEFDWPRIQIAAVCMSRSARGWITSRYVTAGPSLA